MLSHPFLFTRMTLGMRAEGYKQADLVNQHGKALRHMLERTRVRSKCHWHGQGTCQREGLHHTEY